jgi:hypothetical protein
MILFSDFLSIFTQQVGVAQGIKVERIYTSYKVKNQYPATGACQKLASPYVSAF